MEAPRSSPLRLAAEAGDAVLRLAFFAAAPFLLFTLAHYIPITGTLLNLALALVVFLFAKPLRTCARRWPWLRRLLGRKLRFNDYYHQHPPRPFLYYVAFPLLAPYWLMNREALREFLLYKGFRWCGSASMPPAPWCGAPTTCRAAPSPRCGWSPTNETQSTRVPAVRAGVTAVSDGPSPRAFTA